MVLNHIGLNITDKKEITAFYQEVLGFEVLQDFPIPQTIGEKFFRIQETTRAFLVKNKAVVFELFLYNKRKPAGFAHLCLETEDREAIASLCKARDYPVLRMPREKKPDLLFIKDKWGNVFELKNKIS